MTGKLATLALIGILATSLPAVAGGQRHYDSQDSIEAYYDYARVVEVHPIRKHGYRRVDADDCHLAPARHRHSRSDASPDKELLIGGLVGGIIGNRIAGDGHRAEGGIIGAVTGAAVGYAIGKEDDRRHAHRPGYHRDHHCRDDHHRHGRIEGYRVTYVYHGKTFTTRLPYHPGKRMRIQVEIQPVS